MSALRLDHRFRDVKPEPVSPNGVLLRIADAGELLEEPRKIARLDPRTVIPNET
jgi:hypothetical protein